jgi:GNAT superfamily N-acetyltransferase
VTTGERLAALGLELPPDHVLVSLAERPDLIVPFSRHNGAAWPEFMLNNAVADRLWEHLDTDFAAFQLVLLDADGVIAAGCNAAPLRWDGTEAGLPGGWERQFERSVAQLRDATIPNTLGAIQIVVRADRRGTGLAGLMIATLRANARAHGYTAVIACVRPTDKHRYPLIPIDEYARWTRHDGLPFDPWIRAHVRAGGRIARGEPASMRYEATVADWRAWTGLPFPGSGDHILDFAAAPVHVDLEADRGVYLDPNVWVIHELDPGA